MPLCDKSNGESCEVVKSWQDLGLKKHTTPIQLHPANHLAFELWERAMNLGSLREYNFTKGDKKVTAFYPELDALQFVLNNFLPEGLSIDEVDSLIRRIGLIHSLKRQSMLG